MDRRLLSRRRYLRRSAAGLAAGTGVALAGCGTLEEEGNDTGDDGGVY